ncbi:MAG: hypothetical protein ACLQVY_19635 [Limisphaerales bacterium]
MKLNLQFVARIYDKGGVEAWRRVTFKSCEFFGLERKTPIVSS